MPSRPTLALLLLVSALGTAAPARAELDHRLSLLAGGGFWIRPETGGHGVILAAYELKGLLPRQATLAAEFNTDTIRLRADGFRFWKDRLHLSAFTGYEFSLAGLLPDYYRDGVMDTSRGFNASYLELGTAAKLHHPGNHSMELALGARRWFFGENGSTAPELILPAEAWVFEPRLRYTYWKLEPDQAWSERHRLFPRVRGLAFGFVLGFDWRSEARDWGARAASTFGPADLRNDASRNSFMAQQWLLAGSQFHDRVRTQIRQSALLGAGLDDLNRQRVGGLNPYVVQVAGTPWAAYLAEKVLAARWSWHVRFFQQLEAGLLADLAWIDDIHRTGTSNSDVIVGLGLFLDLRWKDFQVDIHAGMAPPLDASRTKTQFAMFADLGWQLD